MTDATPYSYADAVQLAGPDYLEQEGIGPYSGDDELEALVDADLPQLLKVGMLVDRDEALEQARQWRDQLLERTRELDQADRDAGRLTPHTGTGLRVDIRDVRRHRGATCEVPIDGCPGRARAEYVHEEDLTWEELEKRWDVRRPWWARPDSSPQVCSRCSYYRHHRYEQSRPVALTERQQESLAYRAGMGFAADD